MHKKILIPTVLYIFTLIVFVFPLRAEESGRGTQGEKNRQEFPPTRKMDPDKLEDFQQKKEENIENREQKREQICANIEERIGGKVERFQQNANVHVEKYNRVTARLSEIIKQLEEKDFDTSELKEDLAELDLLVKNYAQAYANFVVSLGTVKGHACGDTDADFRASLQISKNGLSDIKMIRQDIRDFYKNTIREDIKNLRLQAQEMYQNRNQEGVDSTESSDDIMSL